MPQSLSNVNIHIVFSTKYRQKLIFKEIETDLFGYIGATVNALKCTTIIVGGYRDHVHLLCKLYRPLSQSKLVEEIKKSSSKWMKTQDKRLEKFSWQGGYGVFSVSQSQVENVKKYIENQEEHHTKETFKEEYVGFLKLHDISYDEIYVWD